MLCWMWIKWVNKRLSLTCVLMPLIDRFVCGSEKLLYCSIIQCARSKNWISVALSHQFKRSPFLSYCRPSSSKPCVSSCPVAKKKKSSQNNNRKWFIHFANLRRIFTNYKTNASKVQVQRTIGRKENALKNSSW